MRCDRCFSEKLRYVGICYEDDAAVKYAYHCESCGYDGYDRDEMQYNDFPQDEGEECTMCGKPVVYGGGGMCSSCRTVWNS